MDNQSKEESMNTKIYSPIVSRLIILLICTIILTSPSMYGTVRANANQPDIRSAYLVRDIATGTASSEPISLFIYNGEVYFAADDGIHGRELWRSDGTESGTFMVKNINPDGASSGPEDFQVFNNLLYFSADDGVHGNELWKTDGTETGTQIVKDITGDPTNSSPAHLVVVNGQLFFAADDGPHGTEL